MECRWTAPSLRSRLPRIGTFCQALASCTACPGRGMTTARRRDLASAQSKPLPARHESSTLFFRPLRSVDMDLVLRSWFSYKNLRTFARHARMTDFLEGESHCPD